MTLEELSVYAEKVKSREDFVKFVSELHGNCRRQGAEWDNNSLELYLSGLGSFANDMDGYYENMHKDENIDVEHITWRIAADMLMGAIVYGGYL